jgi:hypothetical protein
MRRRPHRLTVVATTVVLIGLCWAAFGAAQGRFLPARIRLATAGSFDSTFNFCRVMYRSGPFGTGGGWSADYPSADINLSIRLSELTKIRVGFARGGAPNHLVVRLTDDALFNCPFILMAEVRTIELDGEETARLREYLLKGGFLWVDDYWGSSAWEHWQREISKVLPPSEFPLVDLPADHPMLRSQFTVPRIPQIPNIGYWLQSGGRTSEQGADSDEVHARTITDRDGRVMVFMTHNTDISDSWEREGEDPEYFYRFSVDGYAVAVNVLLHALTH